MDLPTNKPRLQQIATGDFCYTTARKTGVKWPANELATFRKKPYKLDYPGSLLIARKSLRRQAGRLAVLHHSSSSFVQ